MKFFGFVRKQLHAKSGKAVSLRLVLALFLALALVFGLAWKQGYRVNVTPSLPQGIYRITGKPVERDSIVFFCLEPDNPFTELAKERGYLGPGDCPSGLRPLGKHLVGLPGDQVEIRSDQIFLNSKELAGVRIASTDSQNRPLPSSLLQSGTIPAGKALMLSDHHTGSFDSRYYGLVPLDSATPLEAVFIF